MDYQSVTSQYINLDRILHEVGLRLQDAAGGTFGQASVAHEMTQSDRVYD